MEGNLPIYGLAGLSNEQINAELHRNIESGAKYNRYMPFSDCSSVKLGEGDTKVAIDNMVLWASRYKHHTKELSVLFKSNNIEKICSEIHNFLYRHFQYKIDDYKQNLRSPACSWKSRKQGIDCKSYSIFASTILSNLGIKHYFRRIKQGAGEGFTHVYVIVPKNQNNPNDLTKYYCIDGTLPFKSEPMFYEKDDVFVESKGLGYVVILGLVTTVLKILAPFIQQAIAALLTENCADDNLKIIAHKIETQLMPFIKGQLAKIEEGILFNNISQVENGFNTLFFEFDLGLAQLKNYEVTDSSCQNRAVSEATKHLFKVKEVIDSFFQNYVNTQRHVFVKIKKYKALTNKRNVYFIVPINYNPTIVEYKYVEISSTHKRYDISTSFPYGKSGQTFEDVERKWIYDVEKWIAKKSNQTQANKFIREVKPLVKKIKNVRAKLHFGAVGVFLLEQPFQRQINRLFLKYDKDFQVFVLNKSKDLLRENELTFKKFEVQIKEDRKRLKTAKNRKNIKRAVSAVTAFLIVLTIYNIKKGKNEFGRS